MSVKSTDCQSDYDRVPEALGILIRAGCCGVIAVAVGLGRLVRYGYRAIRAKYHQV